MTGPVGPHVVTRKARMTGGGGIDDPVEAAPAKAFPGCAVYPRGNGSEASGRELTVIEGKTILIPDVDAEILPEDILEWRGKDYEVVGDPGEWFHLDGTPAALQVNVQRARG